MEVLALVTLFILVLVGLIISIIKDKITLAITCSFALGTLYMSVLYCIEIKPIDVYRGNTILEITYKDGVAVDSVVVWKDNIKEEQ